MYRITSTSRSGMVVLFVALLAAAHCPQSVRGRHVTGSTAKVFLQPRLVNTVKDEFLSFAIDDSIARHNWRGLNFSSERLRHLVRGLQPAFLRFGGNSADCLIFEQDVDDFRGVAKCMPFQKKTTPFQLTASSWLELREFLSTLSLPLLFDLNSLLRHPDGRWNDTNARRVISTLRAELQQPTLWQLGNEPNSYQHKYNYSVPPETLGTDFVHLRQLLGSGSQLVGPDVTRPKFPDDLEQRPVDLPGQEFLRRFLETGRAAVDAVTFHQYYFNGRTANVSDFLDLRHLNVLPRQIAAVRKLADGAAIWITETGSAWGGGAPGLSDRYLAGFLWLDKLGLAAQQGVSLVVRQSLYGGYYALLDKEMMPNPDYWLSYVYKLVMGPRVLQVDMSGSSMVRMYCHCRHKYLPRSSVSCFTLNLAETPQKIRLDSRLQSGGIQYMMTPPNGDITSQGVLCNGRLLALEEDRLPVISPAPLPAGPTLSLPAYSMAFHVFRRAAPAACMQD